jgi:DNA sulfur modification protein DndD
LENFRPFFGRNEIDLTTTKEKPVVLVKAMNDVGKTSLFTAFIWCLYGGSVEENFRNVNWSAHRKSDGRTSVNLIFSHDDRQYDIQRSVDFEKLEGEVSFQPFKDKISISVDGIPETFDDTDKANNFIKSILPKDAAQFFFFDGEKIQKYTRMRSGATVKDAIQVVLGIKELLNSEEDLKTIKGDLRKELDRFLAQNKKTQEDAKQNEKLREKISSLSDTIPTLEEQIASCEETKKSCDDALKENTAIQQKVEERKKEEEKAKELSEKIENNENSQLKMRGDLAFLLTAPLLEELEKTGQEQIPHWKRNAIGYILASQSNRCICNRPLNGVICPKCGKKIDSKIEEYFQDQLEKGHGGSLLQYLGNIATSLLREKPPQFLEKSIYDLATERVDLESQVSVCKSHIEELKKEIGEHGDFSSEIARLESNRSRAIEKIEEYERKKREMEIEILIKEREYEKKQEELVGKTGYDEDVRKTEEHLHVCTACLEGFNHAIEALVESSTAKVAELASKTFLRLTNAPRLYEGLEITGEYDIKIRTKGGTVRHVWDQAPGAGQRQIIAISFIAALNAFTARDAPIVIDTPISRLDPIHKRNLVCHYPQMGPQTIILYQPNELGDEEIELIHGSICSEWELKRDPSDPETTIIAKMKGV